MISSIHELLQREAQAVLNIPVTDAYEKAVELIVEQVHRKKGKLVTSGMGKAGQIAIELLLLLFVLRVFLLFFFTPVKLNMAIWEFCRKMTCCFLYPIRVKRVKSWN